jgi:hypothetical protein
MAKIEDILKHISDSTITFSTNLLSRPKEKIAFRALKTKDQKQLVIDKEEVEKNEYENFVTLINLVSSCIVKTNIPLGSLALQDFISLLLDIKIKSLGETVQLTSTCPHCKFNEKKVGLKTISNDFTLDFLKDVQKTSCEKIVDNVIKISDKLSITIGHITVEDFLNILEFIEEDARKIAGYASMIKTVEYNGEIVDVDTVDAKIKIIEEMNKDQLEKFSEFEKKNELNIKAVKTFNCKNEDCGKEITVTMSGFDILSFF